jgi:hypothetical protein
MPAHRVNNDSEYTRPCRHINSSSKHTGHKEYKKISHNHNDWASGLCPSSEILNTSKHNVSEIESVSILS